MKLFFWLVASHVMADYPWQSEWMARAKNQKNPLPGIPWYTVLLAHSTIHGALVALFTGSIWLGCAEIVAHFLIDWAKSETSAKLNSMEDARHLNFLQTTVFNLDQLLHIICKVTWVLIANLKP